MPTAHEYWQAARDFAALAASLDADAAPTRDLLTDDVVVGGRLRPTLDDAVDEVVRGVAVTAGSYEAIAAECARRAEACATYTAGLAEYQRAEAAWAATTEAERDVIARPRPPRRAEWMHAG